MVGSQQRICGRPDAVQELLDDATLITINANLFETKLRIFAEDTKSRYAPFFKSSARVADLKKHLGALFVG